MSQGVPENGNWSLWESWSPCSVNCGHGTKTRYRYCNNPSPKNGGSSCIGIHREVKSCVEPFCSGNGLANPGQQCADYCTSKG